MKPPSDGPEHEARQIIDSKLADAGWDRIDDTDTDDTGYRTEVITESGIRCDYVFYLQGIEAMTLEAKPLDESAYAPLEQSEEYALDLPGPAEFGHVPFAAATNGSEIRFRDLRPNTFRERELSQFFSPDELERLLSKDYTKGLEWLSDNPVETTDSGLRYYQKDAVEAIEAQLADGRMAALIHMATGTGKTRTAIASVYRLLRSGLATRVLFIPDTRALANQAHGSFCSYKTPSGQTLADEFVVTNLEEDDSDLRKADVVVTTLQKMYTLTERDDFELRIGDFDVIVTDECHRSIYKNDGYGAVLNLFDAFEIGLTATPTKRTVARFEGKVAARYGYERGVEDGYVAPFDMHRIRTRITMEGIEDKDGVFHSADTLGRSFHPKDTHRKVAEIYKQNSGPKDLALVFAVSQAHAEEVVKDFRTVFNKDEVDWLTSKRRNQDTVLQNFRDRHTNPRILVTVDMLTTGVDIRALNNIILLRPVQTPVLYNQMMGRGTRQYDGKTHFTIYDCVGASEYFAAVPPFNTETWPPNDPTDGDPTEGGGNPPESELVIVNDLDEVVENTRFIRTRKEILPYEAYQLRFMDFVQDALNDDTVIAAIADTTRPTTEEQIADAEEVLEAQEEKFSLDRLRRVFGSEQSELIDFIYWGVSPRKVISTPEDREEAAVERLTEQESVSDEERWWLRILVKRTSVEETALTRIHFTHPQLVDAGGWQSAADAFGSDEALVDVLERIRGELLQPAY
ncbi:DEAD/DEAH box helicase family protein [Salinigranum marinum]|uniref:DEAD/DEAH box helicase family protein n=1 Tax=Salinigranum marinum TaxID=1515595 RepID=UPI002989A2F3|nr:DEAD/DEAH box helicase family protein [Salinigranum marinum]